MENRVDPARAQEEYEQLVAVYKKLGLEVLVLPAEKDLPDMVYTANCGFVIDDIFIRANFRYPQRRREAICAEKFFATRHPSHGKTYQIHTLPEHIFFEGQGDMFYRDGKFFCGYGKRTMKEATAEIANILRQEVITIEVNDPYYYHLDTCFAPIGKGVAIVKPDSFKKEGLETIKKNFQTLILVGEGTTSGKENPQPFLACNSVAIGDTVISGAGVTKEFRRQLKDAGFDCIEIPTTEYLKGGGSVKCCTLEFF